MSAPPLEVRALRKAYRRRPVLQDLSFSAAPGEAVAIVGSNGAGKSTLLGCITGDRLPDGGSIRVCGTNPFSDLPSAARCMGFVPEQPFLYGELTVGEMLGFVAAARALGDAAATERDRLLELLQLDSATGLLCRELSQGMGRKVALIVALLHQPPLLVLDEALNGLDRVAIERVIAELDARRAAGAAVLLSSHDLDFLAQWCDRGLLLGTGARWRNLSGEDWGQWRQEPGLWSAADGSPAHS